ncbi:unnamed protein product [Brassicogethes aeneus]|uniref:Cytosolic carboxypeptidase N-terminal domain-containing protein n=1 Tax=Brassicogethes aeneus TaxID=1431903 RepID=A0A9P0BCC4_BRAAE|nr:unnamed protein product [Brassicogethes aeneus]
MGDFGEDSDDSDGEGGQGNVNRQIMRPPGHSGKAKRGHLCFDASFETGNLGRVDLVNEYEYDLFIRPDTCSPRLRFWFNFTVDNVKQDQRVVFNIVNISKERNLFMEHMTPIVKSSSRLKWQRIPKHHVYYHKSQQHHNHYVLSFSFGFDKEDDVFQFALAPPYSYSKLQTFLSVSIYGYKLKGSDVVIPYTEESCAIPMELTNEPSQKKRPKTHKSRRKNRVKYQKRPLTSRTQALMHFKNLNINYDSETSFDDYTYSYRNASPQRNFEKITEQYNLKKGGKEFEEKFYRSDSPLPQNIMVLPEPSLSIIDFNIMSRNDIEKASNLNKERFRK